MKIKISATTDVGKERNNNEDAYIICSDLSQQDWAIRETSSYIPLNEYGSVLVVADGMGGANAGEIASAIATESIKGDFSKENVEKLFSEKSPNISKYLRSCITNADHKIRKKALEDPQTFGMGTTIVICWILDQVAHIAWCGDSRGYVFNPYKGLKQLTKDHSLVQDLVDNGKITEEESFTHPDSNIITRGLGDFDTQAKPDIISYSLSQNDFILLCSDGLCGYCKNKEIATILDKNYTNVGKCRDVLLQMAIDAGGYDNICIVLASVISDEQKAPSTLNSWQKLIKRLKSIL